MLEGEEPGVFSLSSFRIKFATDIQKTIYIVLQLRFSFRARARTCVNIWGDCVGVAVVEQLSKKHLVEFRREEQEENRGREVEVCDEVANDLDSNDEDVETLEMKKMI